MFFRDVIGQEEIKRRLIQEVREGRIPHAQLICGPEGVGKMPLAIAYARYISCTNRGETDACGVCPSCVKFNKLVHPDVHFVFPIVKSAKGKKEVCDDYIADWRPFVINNPYFNLNHWLNEMDAENSQALIYAKESDEILKKLSLKSSEGGFKITIVWLPEKMHPVCANKLLKLLEEPPEKTVFLLVSEAPDMILPTILSRCQIYDFNRIGIKDTIDHLQYVAKLEHINAEPEALTVIAQKADGGMRDALSIFDQVVSFTGGNITYKSVIENLNVLDYEYYFKLTDLLLENKVPESMLLFNDVLKKGFDGSHFITGLSSHFRDLLVSKDPSTLQLLEVGAGIRDRYKEQAQKCDQKFLYRAMKLCNDCDLNYRASKNKRLLVELTLIQCAQLTLPDADDVSGGRGPKKILKPLFTQQAASTAATQSQPQAKTAAAQTAATAAPQPQGTSTAGSMNASRPSPLPQTREEKKIPVFKAGSLGISLRRPLHEQQAAEKQEAKAASTAAQNDATYEDYIFNEKDLDYYWREFAAALPKEEKANSARMMNMHPHLLNDTTFEVTVDNDMVEKYMVQLIPSVQNHLRERLHNRKITMTVRVSAPTENIRAYSHVERFQMMSKKNPNLLKLKEALGLELS